jgi:chloramphenicol 3-O-phosphotransferase
LQQVHGHSGTYDLEIDTERASPQECAEKIRARVESREPPDALKRLAKST